jgi:DNA-binding response OmpR family regulator
MTNYELAHLGRDAEAVVRDTSRIRAQLRQHEASEDVIFTIGPMRVLARLEAVAQLQGRQGPSDRKGDFDPSRSLSRGPAANVARGAVAGGLGYNSEVTTHALEMHIYRLRQTVEMDAAAPEILITESRGYKLVP